MKKLLSVMMVFILVSTHLAIADPASAGKKTDSSITVSINGETLSEKGIVKNGRTFLPVAVIGKKLDLPIEWNQSTKTAVIKGNSTVEVKIGSKQALVNGEVVTLDVPAFVSGGRTMLPVAFIAKHLSLGINYDAKAKVVAINSSGRSQSQQPSQPEPQQPQPEQPSTPQPGKIQKVVIDGAEVPFEVINGRTYVPFNSLKSTLKIQKIAITHPFNHNEFLHFENGRLEISFTTYPGGYEYYMDENPHGDSEARVVKSSKYGWLVPVKKIIQVFKIDYYIENGVMVVDSSNPGYVIKWGPIDPLDNAYRSEFYEWQHYGTVHGVKYKGWDKDQGGPIQPY
ncbi:MAG: stalk domain-containing protein [Peptostreptococcaceae bacterium]|nr:stalk domain-containing protein [Peptostreptococcaceae bacterium]